VRESVEALLRLIETPAAIGDVVNLGSDREVTIGQLAEMVREIVDSPSDIVHVPYDEAYAEGFEDLERRVPDVRKLEQLTGFRFSIPLEQIIEDVVDDQRRRLFAKASQAPQHRAVSKTVSGPRTRGSRGAAPARG
jgi:UDP-glucose 4-epimerase